MKRLFSGKVFDLLLGANSVVFPYLKADMEDDKKAVFFKMVSLENYSVQDAPTSVYYLTKFGQNYPSALKFSEFIVEASAIVLNDGSLFVVNPDGSCGLIDINGEVIWKGEMKYKGSVPSSITLSQNELWASFKERDAIIRFSRKTLRSELRIGGRGSLITGPESVFADGVNAYICLPSLKKIMKINLKTFQNEDYLFFEEPVHRFVKSGEKEFVVLESGLYRI